MATVKSGFLQKLSGLFKRDWKKRYFVLYQDGELVYYERVGDQQIDGRVNIRHDCHRIDYGYQVERDVQDKAKGRVPFLFSIETTQKTLVLLADTEEDALGWVQKLNEIRQNVAPTGGYGPPVTNSSQPGIMYPGSQPGMPYPPNSQSAAPYPNGPSTVPFSNSQSGVPYQYGPSAMAYPPSSQSGMPVPPNQSGSPYQANRPGLPYPAPTVPSAGMPAPYPVGTAYPGQQAPNNYPRAPGHNPVPYQPAQPAQPARPAQPAAAGAYAYPAYQTQQVVQKKKGKSKKGLLAGAAGGALAGGLVGFGMGRAVGGFGDSFDFSDSDSDGYDFEVWD